MSPLNMNKMISNLFLPTVHFPVKQRPYPNTQFCNKEKDSANTQNSKDCNSQWMF